MTSRERAESVAQSVSADPFMRGLIADCVESVLNTAVADEREACANVADEHREMAKSNSMYPAYGLNSQAMAAGNIADLIRERGNE